MPKLSKRATERISSGLKRFQPILTNARSRDVNESDTVVIVADLLQEVFGYDKYAEITSEHMVRGTFCDLAVKLDGTLAFLIEVKAIGLELKQQHIKQAVDHAANQGCDWVALTNGVAWKVYKAFREALNSALHKLNLPFEERLSSMRLTSVGADLQVGVQSWIGTGQIRIKGSKNRSLLSQIVSARNEHFRTSSTPTNMTSRVFYIILGIFLVIFAVGMSFFGTDL